MLGTFFTNEMVERMLEGPDMMWMIEAENSNTKILRWILFHHSEVMMWKLLSDTYKKKDKRSLICWHAICDQLLPSAKLDTAPSNGVTADSTKYYELVAEWGKRTDLGRLGKDRYSEKPQENSRC